MPSRLDDPANRESAITARRLTTAFPSDITKHIEQIEREVAAATDDGERGSLLLGRALVLQGSSTPGVPAADALRAFHHLRDTDRVAEAALAAAISAGMIWRTGDIEQAVTLAVEAMIRLDRTVESVEAARAANAVSILFHGFSAFEFSLDYSHRALELLGDHDGGTRDVVDYTHCSIAVEARRAGLDVSLASSHQCVARLLQSDDEVSVRVLGAGMRAELLLVENPEDVDAAEILPGSAEIAAPRLASWFRLVLAEVSHQRGDSADALTLLDQAIPELVAVRDDHRVLRAYELRSRVRRALGDVDGALDDATERGDIVRSWHVMQVGRLSVQIAQRAELERSRDSLQQQASELAAEIESDPLTGVASRRRLDAELDELVATPPGHAPDTVAIVVFDLDRFKAVNDTFGHGAGDDVLREVGAILSGAVRPEDLVARLGGEEFVVVMRDAPAFAALGCADRVRAELADRDWSEIAPGLPVRASAGVAVGRSEAARSVLERADDALYRAKRAGRNRTVIAGDPRLTAVTTRTA
ncbi:MAG: GGDEF domain-containing protein [Ilumatobacter sp.]